MIESNHKESRKKAREFIEAFERGIGRADFDQLFTLYEEAVKKAEEYKHYPHYLIALVRSPWRLRDIIPGYYDNHKQIRQLMVTVYGEEQTKAFLVGIEPTT